MDQTLTHLYLLHYGRLVRVALLILGDLPSAEDAVQEAYVVVYPRLDKLRDTDKRAVIVLRYHGGMSEAEIAAALGIRQGSVKSHASRGMAALKARPIRRQEEP